MGRILRVTALIELRHGAPALPPGIPTHALHQFRPLLHHPKRDPERLLGLLNLQVIEDLAGHGMARLAAIPQWPALPEFRQHALAVGTA